MKEKIEKISKLRLVGFPDSDFLKIEEKLNENPYVDIWIIQGMGRKYITAIVGKNLLPFPLMEKICTLAK